jgi:hypothetical protein
MELFQNFSRGWIIWAQVLKWVCEDTGCGVYTNTNMPPRFVAQSSYEKASQMHVSPVPDVVTCVFILSRRACPDDVVLWAAAAHVAAQNGATFWSNVASIQLTQCMCPLFRVLERGGMETEQV